MTVENISRMLPTSAGVEPGTSWSPVGRASNCAIEAGISVSHITFQKLENGHTDEYSKDNTDYFCTKTYFVGTAVITMFSQHIILNYDLIYQLVCDHGIKQTEANP